MPKSERDEAVDLYWQHLETGEPLSEDEVGLLWKYGIIALEDIENVGGNLYRHVKCGTVEV